VNGFIRVKVGDPRPTVRNAIKRKHYHKGFMADYKLAHALVKWAIEEERSHCW
jgi:hypothetical protein